MKDIIIKNAKENNLKSVSLTIPRDKLVVFTGLSGSGKSSLAFDTIFAEGQRRYVESLSAYARRREYRWSFSRNFDRPKDNFVQPAFYGRHGNGNIRLSPFAVRPYRRAVLSALRIGNNQDDGGSNLRPRYVASSRNQASNTCADSART